MRVFGLLQQRAAQFWRENLPACVAFFFLIALGAACGHAACLPLLSAGMLDAARELVAGPTVPQLLLVMGFAIPSEMAWICAILFAGLQRWTVPLWMLCVALRGFVAGAAAALCTLAGSPLLWLLLVATQIPLLLASLRLAAFAIRSLRRKRNPHGVRRAGAAGGYLAQGLQLSTSLLLVAILEAALLPLLLYLLAH